MLRFGGIRVRLENLRKPYIRQFGEPGTTIENYRFGGDCVDLDPIRNDPRQGGHFVSGQAVGNAGSGTRPDLTKPNIRSFRTR